MKRLLVVVLTGMLMLGTVGPVLAGSKGATCSVSPSSAADGEPITVTVSGITRQMTPYGWFALYDIGPTETQAVSSLDLGTGSAFGDNGSYLVSWSGGVAVFSMHAQDPGTHLVEAVYRKVFASCQYAVPPH